MIHDFRLDPLNTHGRRGSYTYYKQNEAAGQSDARSFIDYAFTRAGSKGLPRRAHILRAFPVGSWRGGGKHLPIDISLTIQRFKGKAMQQGSEWPQRRCRALWAEVQTNPAAAQSFATSVGDRLSSLSSYDASTVNSILLSEAHSHFPARPAPQTAPTCA